MRRLFAQLRIDGHELGLHPGFAASLDATMIAEEARTLSQASGTALHSVRQHYLRFRAPETWIAQSDAGFRADSTLGFAEREGFRNGACHPFLAFDLDAGRALPIWEMPLHVMDGTLLHYRGMDAEAASERISALRDVVAREHGVFTVLVHNIIADAHDYPGWASIFSELLQQAGSPDVHCGTVSELIEEWVRSGGYASLEEVQKNASF